MDVTLCKVQQTSNLIPRWKEVHLHAWATVTTLYGAARPNKPEKKAVLLEGRAREEYIRRALGLEHASIVHIRNPLGRDVILNDRVVVKLHAKAYSCRMPYIRWILSAPGSAVEIWRNSVTSRTTGESEVRTYYLVPLNDAKDYDGYVVMTGNDNAVFNVMPFKASYADAVLRQGELLYKSYSDEVLCSVGCCEAIATIRREAGKLKDRNWLLEQCLQKERKARKALDLEIQRLNALVEQLRAV